MSDWCKHFLSLINLNSIMKKTTTSSEKPVAKDKAEKSTSTKVTKKTIEKPVTTEVAKTTTEAPVIATTKTKSKASVAKPKKEASVIVDVTETTPAAPITVEATQIAPVEASESITVSPEITMHERIGLTAGSIWHYLAENGATSVAKLVEVLPEAEEIIQRSIGWLGQENKITLSVADQVETIALKQ